MKIISSSFTIVALFIAGSSWSQDPTFKGPSSRYYSPEPVFQNQRVQDSLMRWEERMYLHTDRSAAMPGEYIFFKAYAMTGPKKLRVSPSGVLKVDLIDPSGVQVSNQYYPLVNGSASGAVEIPKDLEPNTYTLRAYTRWMQNYGSQQYFTRQIHVSEDGIPTPSPSKLSQVAQVRFYPEGGELLRGLNNKVIIRAWDALGCPVHIDGEIRDASNRKVGDVLTYDTGLGMSILKPEQGTSYFLHLDTGVRFALPEVASSGYSFKVNTLNPEHVKIIIDAVGMGEQTLELLGKRGEEVFLKKSLEPSLTGHIRVEIPKDQLPVGMVDFTLMDSNGDTVAERPVRLEGPESLSMEIVPITQDLTEGGVNALRLKVVDADGNPVQTEVSLSAVEYEEVQIPTIKEYVRPNPGLSDIGQFRKALFLDDLNALAESSIPMDQSYPEEIKYPIQSELELIGYVYDLNNELLRNTEIQVMSSTDDVLFIREVVTDGSGILQVSGMQFTGEIPLIFRTKGEDTRSSLVRFEHLHEEIYKEDVSSIPKPLVSSSKKSKRPVETTPWAVIDTTGLIALAEATVTAMKVEEKDSPSIYGIKPRRVVKQDPRKPVNGIGELLQRMPGVFLAGDIYDSPGITVPSQFAFRGSITWVIDGLITNQSPFALLPPLSIDRIELLSPSDAAIYGSRGSGAVFAIYTRDGSGAEYVRRKDAMITFKGFESDLPFGEYLDERRKNRKLRKQAPTTLYWNAAVQTDANGEAVVRFKSPADYDRIRVSAETLTPEGRPGAVQLVMEKAEEAGLE